MNRKDILKILKSIKSEEKIPGINKGTFYEYVGISAYSGKGKFSFLNKEPVVVIKSPRRKRALIKLFLEPILLLINGGIEHVGYGTYPSEYVEKYYSGDYPSIPNLFEYDAHYKAIAKYIWNKAENDKI